MREVDHAHHAEDDREPEPAQDEERERVRELIEESVRLNQEAHPRPSRKWKGGPATCAGPASALPILLLGQIARRVLVLIRFLAEIAAHLAEPIRLDIVQTFGMSTE